MVAVGGVAAKLCGANRQVSAAAPVRNDRQRLFFSFGIGLILEPMSRQWNGPPIRQCEGRVGLILKLYR